MTLTGHLLSLLLLPANEGAWTRCPQAPSSTDTGIHSVMSLALPSLVHYGHTPLLGGEAPNTQYYLREPLI